VGKDAILWLADWLLSNNPNKPQVILPDEVKVESKSAGGTDDASIVWVIGGPGSGRTQSCARLAAENGYEVISVADIMKSAVTSATPYGEVISECQRKGGAVPCHVISSLLTSAMAANRLARIAKANVPIAVNSTEEKEEKRSSPPQSTGTGTSSGTKPAKGKSESAKQSRFIVTDFPITLDQAFDFEQRAASPTLVIYLDGNPEVLLKRAADEKDSNGDSKISLSRKIANFKEDVLPIIEHYQVFNKVRKVTVNGSDDDINGRLTRALKGQLVQ